MTDGGALPAGLLPHGVGADARRVARLDHHGRARRTAGTSRRSTSTPACWPRPTCVHADVAVVAQGPGNLGTGTRWGFSGTSAGEAVNAAATLGGRAVASLRVSQADARSRHQGVSHHSLTAYGRVALAPADVPVPLLPGAFGARVRAQAAQLVADSGGRLRAVRRGRGRPGGGPGAQPGAALHDGPGHGPGRGVVPRGGGRRAARGLPGLSAGAPGRAHTAERPAPDP